MDNSDQSAVHPSVEQRAQHWRDIYRRYRALEREWAIADAPPEVSRQFFGRTLRGPLHRDAFLREVRSFGLSPPAPALLEEALALREALANLPGGRHPDDPYENVFQAALASLGRGFWEAFPGLEQVYRGQQEAKWKVVPSLFREGAAVGALLARLRSVVHALRAIRPDLTDEQAVALAQHYGRELNVRTWLIDVTYEPRVAFFFASHGGRTGQVGVVTCIVRREWERLNAEGRNRLGAIRLIEVPNVVRLARQRALFLDTSHPDLFEQYVPHSIWFRQCDGVAFEDDDVQPPISERSLYPPEDDLLHAVRHLEVVENEEPITAAPASDAAGPLGSDDYHAIATSWCDTLGVRLDPSRDGTLKIVCDFHALLQQYRQRIDIPERSLLRLQQAVEKICAAQRKGRDITPADALYSTFTRVPPDDAKWLRARLSECIDRRE